MLSDVLIAILTNPLVWSSFLNLVNTLLFYFIPTFPREVWLALSTFINSILGALGIAIDLRAKQTCRSIYIQPFSTSLLDPLVWAVALALVNTVLYSLGILPKEIWLDVTIAVAILGVVGTVLHGAQAYRAAKAHRAEVIVSPS